MRTIGIALAMVTAAGCAQLGVVHDGTTVSVGKASDGALLEGARLPDRGEGFVTRDVWKQRGNRYGTDEMIDLIVGVGRQIAASRGTRLVVADLSSKRGGEARQWHRSHQSGRDVDLVYFMRDATGAPVEPDAMRPFGPDGVALDGSEMRVDIPKMWLLVKSLVSAHEATVQRVFIYEPIAVKIIEHAVATNEPEGVIVRARLAMKQPGDSAPHNDHVHVRIYCSDTDVVFGCVDFGPQELLVMRRADIAARGDAAAQVAVAVEDGARLGASAPALDTITATAVAAAIHAPTAMMAVPSGPGGLPPPPLAPYDLYPFARILRRPMHRLR